MAAELLERQRLEEFLIGADPARQRNEGVRRLFHTAFALGHGLGEKKFAAVMQEDAGLVKKARRDAERPAALLQYAAGAGAHQPLPPRAEYETVPAPGNQRPELLRVGKTGGIDALGRSAEYTDVHRKASG